MVGGRVVVGFGGGWFVGKRPKSYLQLQEKCGKYLFKFNVDAGFKCELKTYGLGREGRWEQQGGN